MWQQGPADPDFRTWLKPDPAKRTPRSCRDRYVGAWNHGTMQSLALLAAGCVLDEGSWQNAASARLQNEVVQGIDTQGAILEQAPGYAQFIQSLHREAQAHLAACGLPVPAGLYEPRGVGGHLRRPGHPPRRHLRRDRRHLAGAARVVHGTEQHVGGHPGGPGHAAFGSDGGLQRRLCVRPRLLDQPDSALHPALRPRPGHPRSQRPPVHDLLDEGPRRPGRSRLRRLRRPPVPDLVALAPGTQRADRERCQVQLGRTHRAHREVGRQGRPVLAAAGPGVRRRRAAPFRPRRRRA